MEYNDKEFCLEVWGDYACFTRPEMKVERVSYDVITPSAARAIFQAIFWKPAINWQITKIEVINPIKWYSVRRNEVGAVAAVKSKLPQSIYIEDKRQQRNTLCLKDVRYRIYAKMIYVLVSKRDPRQLKHAPDANENPQKYYEMFTRRASNGQTFNQPYLGCREFSASFRLVSPEEAGQPPVSENRDLGIMLYDMDFSNPKNIKPTFSHPVMENGVIHVPSIESEELFR